MNFRYIKLTLIFTLFISVNNYIFSTPNSVVDLIAVSGLSELSEGSIKLKWTFPGPGNLPAESKYYVQYTTFSTVFWSTMSAQVIFSTGPVTVNEQQEYTIQHLTGFYKDVKYYFVLWSSSGTEQIFSSISNVATGWITAYPPSSANFVDATQGDSEGKISLFWSGVGDDGKYNPLDVGSQWIIDYSTDANHFWNYDTPKVVISTSGINSATTVQYVISGLLSGVTYYFRLWTKDDVGNISEISNGATTWAQVDISAPKSVTNILVKSGYKHIQLTWTIPVEDDTLEPYNSSIYSGSYEVRYSSTQINTENLWNSATTIFFITGVDLVPNVTTTTVLFPLTNNTTYFFAIKVADEKNNWSTVVGSSSPYALPKNNIPSYYPSTNISKHYAKDPLRNFVNSLIISSTTIVLDWGEVGWNAGWTVGGSSDSVYGDYISSYTLKISTFVIGTSLGESTLTISGIIEFTSYTIHNLIEDTTYWWNLTVYDSESLSNVVFSSTIFRFIINSQNSFAPEFTSNPLLKPTTYWHTKNFSIEFDWKNAFDKDPGDFISKYEIILSTVSDFNVIITTVSVTNPATSYFLMTQVSTPASTILLPYDNKKIYWYVIAYDSGAPFGYQRLESLPTQATYFYINQKDESPYEFNVYPASGPGIVKYYDLGQNTTFYIVKNLPIYLNWDLTTDPDPQDVVIGYTIFIGTSLAKDPQLGIFEGGWRYVEDNDTFQNEVYFSSTVINSNPAAGTAPDTDLYLIENLTYYWRVRAIDKAYHPVTNPFWIWNSTATFSPNTSVSPMMFIIDFTSDAPNNYDAVAPVNVYNPTSLSAEINFSWTQVVDPDPLDRTKYLYLFVSTYIPSTSEGWFNATITTITTLSGETTFYNITLLKELAPGNTFFWQVLSWGEREWNIETSTSNPFTALPYGFLNSTASFVVSNNVPNKFSLVYPGTSTTSELYSSIKLFKPTFYWEVATDNDNYEPYVSSYVVRISSYSNFSFVTEVWVSTNYYFFGSGLQSKTTYWWTVIAYDKVGNYQTPYSTFVFSVDNFSPSEFLLVEPVDNVVIQTLTPVFKWQNNGDPDGDDIYYTIQYSSYSNFSIFLSSGYFISPSQKGTTVQISSPWTFEENKQIFWRVVAKDTPTFTVDLTTSNITTFWTNYVEEKPLSFDINITSGFLSTLQPIFSWSPTSDPDPKDYVVYYKLCISTISSYVVSSSTYIIIVGSNNVNYTMQFPLTENVIYNWWVEAYDTTGLHKISNTSYYFVCDTIDDGLNDFNLVFPGSELGFNSIVQPSTFIWSAANRAEWWKQVNYSLYYTSNSVQISSAQIFSDVYRQNIESSLFKATTSYTFYGLQENTTYFWWVVAVSTDNSKIKSSTTFYFFVDSINDPPESFDLLYPTGTITVNTRTPEFKWGKVIDIDDGISHYKLQYCDNTNFESHKTTSVLINISTATTHKLSLGNILSMETTYYWKIIVYDKSSSFTTSNSTGSFYVPSFKPSTFVVTSPTKSVFTKKPTISWTNSNHLEENSYVINYELNISTMENFLFKTTTFVAGTNFMVEKNLFQNTTYYLNIVAIDNFGVRSDTVSYNFFINKINIPKKIQKLTYGYNLQNNFVIAWQKVTQYDDGTEADDILGYNIYRNTDVSLLTSDWQPRYDFLPSTVTIFLDKIQGGTFYYLVKVVTLTGVESESSDIVSSYNRGSRVLYRPEIEVKVVIPSKVESQMENYGLVLDISSETISLSEIERMNMINKYNLFITKNSQPVDIKLDAPLELEIGISKNNFATISKSVKNETLTPKLFWHNGIEYIFINSGYNATTSKLTTKTKNIGNFVIRAVSFANKNEIVNIYPKKIFTPSAPVDNVIHFVLNNISVSQPEGEIYDISLRYVSKMKYENYELVWDGKYDSGEIVPKGIYLYKIKIGDSVFTGTIIVAK